jgi:hypothetical protein
MDEKDSQEEEMKAERATTKK